jgi:hypothetical protein
MEEEQEQKAINLLTSWEFPRKHRGQTIVLPYKSMSFYLVIKLFRRRKDPISSQEKKIYYNCQCQAWPADVRNWLGKSHANYSNISWSNHIHSIKTGWSNHILKFWSQVSWLCEVSWKITLFLVNRIGKEYDVDLNWIPNWVL